MERLQGVISLRVADTSGDSSYCFGAASLVKKISAVGSFKELNLVKVCDDLKMTCVLCSFILDNVTYIKNKYSHCGSVFFFDIVIFLFFFPLLIFSFILHKG